jgi:hypothetical protein
MVAVLGGADNESYCDRSVFAPEAGVGCCVMHLSCMAIIIAIRRLTGLNASQHGK